MAADSILELLIADSAYPEPLREIHNPPQRLFLRGRLPEGIFFAVVGSRTPSPYGKQITPKLVEPLAVAGLVIVSGLAYGIDALAHEAALAQRGFTIAVLGTGVDDQALYPRTHRKLAQRIVDAGGAIVSEYPPGTPGQPQHFPARNRIIAGLSRGVLVVEARAKSGALITANLALRENRDVFAVPGPITAITSAGTNQLIQQGAKLTMQAEDVLDEYGLVPQQVPRAVPSTLSREEQSILALLAEKTLHVDMLAETLHCTAAETAVRLTALELHGLVRNFGGGRYGRA